MKVEDNFLDQKEFDKMQAFIMIGDFNWFYNPLVDFTDDVEKFQFIHMFYMDYYAVSQNIIIIDPIIKKILPISLCRIKANLLTRTSDIIENEFHIDIADYSDENRKTIFLEKLKQLTTSIFYMNTNNGYTKFEDGTIVESVANRLVSFSADTKHKGTSCTDEKTRVVINFNYFK
jgi:hypothetical protein